MEPTRSTESPYTGATTATGRTGRPRCRPRSTGAGRARSRARPGRRWRCRGGTAAGRLHPPAAAVELRHPPHRRDRDARVGHRPHDHERRHPRDDHEDDADQDHPEGDERHRRARTRRAGPSPIAGCRAGSRPRTNRLSTTRPPRMTASPMRRIVSGRPVRMGNGRRRRNELEPFGARRRHGEWGRRTDAASRRSPPRTPRRSAMQRSPSSGAERDRPDRGCRHRPRRRGAGGRGVAEVGDDRLARDVQPGRPELR